MSTLTENRNGLFHVRPDVPLWGEIITWTCAGVSIRHLEIVEALREHALEESVARELAPRHAFTRACKKLREARIIRQVAEDDSTLTFQFTSERRDRDHFQYELETMLTLDKNSGRVTCPLPGLATLAQEELDRCIQARTGADLTRVVQKLFEQHADLFPIRPGGGAYFVAQDHSRFVDQVQGFLGRLHGKMQRFPVPKGTPHGDTSVKESVANGLAALIEEHRVAIASFGEDTRETTLERAAERIRQTRHKVSAYSAYLAEEREKLEQALSVATRELHLKVEHLAPVS